MVQENRGPFAHDRDADSRPTLELARSAQSGDADALEHLAQRYLAKLRGWARGRLPSPIGSEIETDDLVRDTVVAAIRRMGHIRPSHEGALQAYVRTALETRLRGLRSESGERSIHAPASAEPPTPLSSPYEATVGAEVAVRFERALARLDEDDRAVVVGRLELGASYPELAGLVGLPSADAARMAVARALTRLAREMAGHGG